MRSSRANFPPSPTQQHQSSAVDSGDAVERTKVLLEVSVRSEELKVASCVSIVSERNRGGDRGRTILDEESTVALGEVVGAAEGRESPLLGDDDLLASGELFERDGVSTCELRKGRQENAPCTGRDGRPP